MNVLDVVLVLLIAALFALAVHRIVRDRRSGKCCGNCAGCSHACSQKKS